MCSNGRRLFLYCGTIKMNQDTIDKQHKIDRRVHALSLYFPLLSSLMDLDGSPSIQLTIRQAHSLFSLLVRSLTNSIPEASDVLTHNIHNPSKVFFSCFFYLLCLLLGSK